MSVRATAIENHGCLPAGSQEDSDDKSGLIVAIVIGLLVVAAIVGLGYWFYMKNSRYRERILAFLCLHLSTCELTILKDKTKDILV